MCPLVPQPVPRASLARISSIVHMRAPAPAHASRFCCHVTALAQSCPHEHFMNDLSTAGRLSEMIVRVAAGVAPRFDSAQISAEPKRAIQPRGF